MWALTKSELDMGHVCVIGFFWNFEILARFATAESGFMSPFSAVADLSGEPNTVQNNKTNKERKGHNI